LTRVQLVFSLYVNFVGTPLTVHSIPVETLNKLK